VCLGFKGSSLVNLGVVSELGSFNEGYRTVSHFHGNLFLHPAVSLQSPVVSTARVHQEKQRTKDDGVFQPDELIPDIVQREDL
jgi:hypothetical protein